MKIIPGHETCVKIREYEKKIFVTGNSYLKKKIASSTIYFK